MDELSIVLGAELDLKRVEEQIAELKNKKDYEIKLTANVDEVKKKIADLQKYGSTKANAPKITIDVNKNESRANIKNFIDSLKGTYKTNPIKLAFGVDLQATNAVIKQAIQDIKDQLNNAKFTVDVNTVNAGSKNSIVSVPSGASLSSDTNVDPKIASISKTKENGVLSKEQERWNLELGKTLTITKELDKETQEVKTTIETTTENYEAQRKAADAAKKAQQKSYLEELKYNSKVLEEQQKAEQYTTDYYKKKDIAVDDLELKAFRLNNPLTGTFKETAESAIQAVKAQMDVFRSESNTITKQQEDAIDRLMAKARQTVLEQQKAQYQGQNLTANSFETNKTLAGFDIDIQIEKLKQSGQYVDEVKTKFDGLKESLANVSDQNGLKQWNEDLKTATKEAKAFEAQTKTALKEQKFEIDTRNAQTALDNIKKKYDEIIKNDPSKKNTGIEEHFERVQQAINSINPNTVSLVNKELTGMRREVSGLEPQVTNLSAVLQQNFGAVGGLIARFASGYAILNKTISVIKSMVTEVRSLDSSLVELQKVTNLTGQSLSDFTDRAYDIGKTLGRTGQDVIDAVTTFSRAGYDLNEATALAKSALTMTNVGVDIPNIESAASDMISILKAYDKQADESMQVIDKLYNVANKEPLDFGDITDMLVTAGGTLAQSGTSLEETMGLLTGAFATMRDKSVSNGLIMISQRLRGVKEDGEAIEEADFIPKLQSMFAEVGISIQDENGELRSTYAILQDLAGVWDNLTSKQKQYFGEKVAGNRQVKTLNAIMQNWDVVADTIQKANEATGAAVEGNEKFMDSIEGRITQFQSAFQDLARATIDSDLVKWIVSVGTGILNVTKSLGGLAPVLGTVVGLITTINGAKIVSGFAKLKDAFKLAAGAKDGAKFLDALPGKIGLIITAISALYMIYQKIGNAQTSFEKRISEFSDTKGKLETSTQSLNSLKDQLQNVEDEIAALNKLDKLSFVQSNELKNLQNISDELRTQIELEDTLNKALQGKLRAQFVSAITEYNDGRSGLAGFWDNAVDFTKANLGMSNEGGTQKEIAFSNLERYIGAMYNKRSVQERMIAAIQEESSEEDIEKLRDEMVKWDSEASAYLSKAAEIYSSLKGMADSVEYDYITAPFIDEVNKLGVAIKSTVDEMSGFVSEDTFNAVWDFVDSKYKPITAAIKEIAESGELTNESLKNIDGYEAVLKEFEKVGISAEDLVSQLNKIPTEISVDTTETSLTPLNQLYAELIKNLYSTSDAYKALSSAISEQDKAGVISAATWQGLIEQDENLVDYMDLTADGYRLNTEALYDYIEAQSKQQREDATTEMIKKAARLQQVMEDLAEARYGNLEEKNALLDEQTAISREIEGYAAIIREIDAATGALARYKAAKNSANEDADFNTGTQAFKDIQEGIKTGKIGTDDFKTAVGFVLGENWQDELDRFGGSLEGAYKEAEKLGKRYFGQEDERTGMFNFVEDLAEKGFGTYDRKNKTFDLNEGLSLDEIAEGMNMSADAVKSLFGLLNAYGGDFEFPELISEDEIKKVKETETALKELDDQIEKDKTELDKYDPGTEEYEERARELERKESARKILEKDLESVGGAELDVNTLTLDEALEKLEQMNTLISAGITLPVHLTEQYNELVQFLNNYYGEQRFSELPVDVPIETSGNGEEELAHTKQEAEELDGTTVEFTTNVNGEQATFTIKELKDALTTLDKTNADPSVTVDGETSLYTLNEILSMLTGLSAEEVEAIVGVDDGEAKYTIQDIQTALAAIGEQNPNPVIEATDNASETINSVDKNLNGLNGKIITTTIVTEVDEESYKKADEKLQVLRTGASLHGEELDQWNKEHGTENTIPLPNVYLDEYVPGTAKTMADMLLSMLQESVEHAKETLNKNYIEESMKRFSMGGTVDLLNRPQIPTNKLSEAGWGDFEDGLATVFSRAYNVGENGEIGVVVTPILPDGTVLSPDDLDDYVNNLVVDSDGKIDLGSDNLGLVIDQMDMSQIPEEEWGTVLNAYADTIHQLQQIYYDGISDMSDDTEDKNPLQAFLDATAATIDDYKELFEKSGVDVHLGTVEDAGSGVTQLTSVAKEAGIAQEEVENVEAAYDALHDAIQDYASVDVNDQAGLETASANLQTAAANFVTAYNALENEVSKQQNVTVTADVTRAIAAIDALGNKVVTVTVYGQMQPGFAKGTKNAPNGMSLVDEEGRELIEHTKTGTFELGTNNGPRFTKLEKGDVVHNAKETKGILKRLAAIGFSFRDGFNQARSYIGNAFASTKKHKTTTVSTSVKGNVNLSKVKTSSSSSSKSSSSKSSSPSKKSSGGSSGGGGGSSFNFADYANTYFDWAEIRLERLATATNTWIANAAEALGYAAKNKELAGALSNIQKQVEDTNKAYNLYMDAASWMAQVGGLSQDIVDKIQNGEIVINEYSKDVQEKIAEYQKWWTRHLAQQCARKTLSNCWEALRAILLQRENEISLNANV